MMKNLILLITLFTVSFLNAQTIAEIQGTGNASPFSEQVVTTSGIVTAVNGTGYHLQDGTTIRSGIYIYDQTYTPTLGDQIEITGTVTEYFDLTEIVDLSAFQIISSGNALPAPIELSTVEINQEDYEGMLVKVNQATCTNADLGFGEFELNDGSGACAVDDLYFLFVATEGEDYNLTGPLHYSFSAYKIIPRNENDIENANPLFFTINPKEKDLTTSSITVSWETNIPANSSIEYGLTPDNLDTYLESSDLNTNHELSLENLQPATIYYVRPLSSVNENNTSTKTIVMCTASESSGTIKAYFNHPVDESVATTSNATYTASITDTIVRYIDLAQSTLDFTIYEAQEIAIVNALNAAHDRGVAVRVISDDEGDNEVLIDNLNSAIPVLEGNTIGIMHNKFMIVDQNTVNNSWVLTGSMNHTIANLGWDYNNIICIQDQSLAKGYALEFEEMWSGAFGNQKTDNTPHFFNINGVAVESYFSPTDGVANRIVRAIDEAENDLAFAILVFTENSLGTAVLEAHERGVEVNGIIDYVEFNGDEYSFLSNNGVNVQDYQNADGSQWPDGPTLHHKYAVIDYSTGSTNPLLITGSHNWTASAGSIHDENTLLIYDAEAANWYQQEFWARFFGVVGVKAEFVENALEVSPNPFVDEVQVELPDAGVLEVYDLMGRLVFSEVMEEGVQSVDIHSLSAGSYFLLFKTAEVNYVERVVKK